MRKITENQMKINSKRYSLNSVVIEKNGLKAKYWDCIDGKMVMFNQITSRNIFRYLRVNVEFEKNLLFVDLINCITKYKNLINFMRQYSWCRDINIFIKQIYQKPPENELDAKDPLIRLEIYDAGEWYNCHRKKYNEFTHYASFHGYSKGKTPYAVGTLHLGHLKNLPISINKSFTIAKVDEKPHKITEILKSQIDFTLLTVLDAIFYEISFYGTYEQKKSFVTSITDRINDIDNETDNLVSLNQVKKNILKKAKKDPNA